ncbi:Transmembrane protein 97 [Rhizophlyctis rosea]|uniref:Efficient mitochondria targeting-associated protein 19 n=1 Tax=Rhizophlyctis rosea TaxID=64517 RepID=A0AAD5X8B2_9FUNG|nr:Transmembrane protein 97 [Rhizophlyctis rosea]
MARSLFSRPLDIIFLFYFITHIPSTVLLSPQTLLPPHWVPAFMKEAMRTWVGMSGDPWMAQSLAGKPVDWWFKGIIAFGELPISLPFFFYLIHGLWNDRAQIRIPAIIYSSHVATTLIPILSEIFFAHPELSEDQRRMLVAAYLPYLVIPLLFLFRMTVGFEDWRSGAGDDLAFARKKRA